MVNGAVSIALLAATTIALWAWLQPNHAQDLAGRPTTRRAWFGLTLAVVAVVLVLLGFAGTAALGALALVALAVLLVVRGPLSRREAVVGVLFGVIAAVAGAAEEAWARAFLIPALYFVFALTARPRTALVTAVIISAYWFAFLHAPTDPLFTLGVGTVYGLPMALLWLRRGLEAAIGFHVGLDLVRYVGSYLAAEGLWFI